METSSGETYLVADTSVLVSALPFIRAVIESDELLYTVYIPYVVLTELDRGRTAAPVNQLISRHMRQGSARLCAQSASDHDKVFLAKGIAPNNDDLIMGAALQLKETGKSVILLTNDHNLVSKGCANQLRTMTSLDLMLFLPEAIPALDMFIMKDILALCPQRDTIVRFAIELLASTLKLRLSSIRSDFKPSSTADKLAYEIMDKAVKEKLANESVLRKSREIMKECRGKAQHILMEDVRRLVKYACAILEEMKVKDTLAAKVLNIFKGIYAGIKTPPKKMPVLNFDYSENKKVEITELTSPQQKHVVTQITAVRKLQQHQQHTIRGAQKKIKGIEKDTKHRKHIRQKKLEAMEISDVELSPPPEGDLCLPEKVKALPQQSNPHVSPLPTPPSRNQLILSPSRSSVRIASKRVVPAEPKGSESEADVDKRRSFVKRPTKRGYENSSTRHGSSPIKSDQSQGAHILAGGNISLPKDRYEDSNEMDTEEVVAPKRQRQIEERTLMINVDNEPVYKLLNSAWQHLNNITGNWASLCKVDYPFTYAQISLDITYDHPHLNRWSQLIAEVSDFYERLLRVNFTVSREIQMEMAERFTTNLSKVWESAKLLPCPVTIPSAAEVLTFFQDDRKRELVSGGLEQLRTFRSIIGQCDKKLQNDLFQRRKRKVCSKSARVASYTSKLTE